LSPSKKFFPWGKLFAELVRGNIPNTTPPPQPTGRQALGPPPPREVSVMKYF